MLNKTIIRMLTILLIVSVIMPSELALAKEPNAKDCLEGKVDCTDENQPLLDGLEENNDGTITTSDSNLGLDLLKMFLVLAVILALIYYSLKFVNKRNRLFQKASVLENLGGISVGQSKSIQLIRIGSKVYLIGVGDNVEMLQEIEDETVKEELLKREEGETIQASTLMKSLFRSQETQENNKTSEFKQSFQQELNKLKQNRNHLIQKHKKEDRHE